MVSGTFWTHGQSTNGSWYWQNMVDTWFKWGSSGQPSTQENTKVELVLNINNIKIKDAAQQHRKFAFCEKGNCMVRHINT